MPETPDVNIRLEVFKPSEATLAAWDTQAYLLAYRNSAHDSEQAGEARHNANKAFDRMTALTYPRLFKGATVEMGYKYDKSQDVLQDTYLKAYKGLPKFRGDSQAETWLYRIMLREVSRFYSREAKHSRNRIYAIDENGSFDHQLDSQSAPSCEDEPLEFVLDQEKQQEIQDALREALQELSPKLGRAVLMFYLRDLSHADIIRELKITEATSKVRLCRALKSLREARPLKNLHDHFTLPHQKGH